MKRFFNERHRAVVLAAGVGGRLGVHTRGFPKPLVQAAGMPLIRYTLAGLQSAGCDEVVIVTGYEARALEDSLASVASPRLTFVHNPAFRRGASLSLRAAREATKDEPFVLTMSDHLLSGELLSRLIDQATSCAAPFAAMVAVDASNRWDSTYTAEATKVQRIGDRVLAIGKELAVSDGIDCGAFYCTPRIWQFVDAAPPDCELSVIFRLAAQEGVFRAADVTGASWYDVDTVEDLAAAERMLERA